jgi:predicted N-formylglutamate amidohydrolase
MTQRLLAPDEPPAFCLERPDGSSPYLLTGDHASHTLPRALGTLGLPESELTRHIAWDIGIAKVARRLSEKLDACLVLQNYSRLAIDANRPPGTAQSIITLSERTHIPGNQNLSPAEAELRERELFAPYHGTITSQLDARARAGRPTALCSLHSFTPSYLDASRPWHVGLLYNRDVRLSRALITALRAEPELVVGDNQPYFVSEETDYTVIVHGERRGIPCMEIEIRQDLIAREDGQSEWAERLGRLLPQVYEFALGESARV